MRRKRCREPFCDPKIGPTIGNLFSWIFVSNWTSSWEVSMKPAKFQSFDIEDVETDAIRRSVLDTRFGGNTGAMEISVYGVPTE